MKNTLFTIAGGLALALLAGCAGPEQKLGRGITNTLEVTRMGEMRKSIEDTTLYDSPDAAYTTGVVRGLDRTLARTGLGIWEIATFPFPNHEKSYGAIATRKFSANPVYPSSYKPRWYSDSTMETDSKLGFGNGDILPCFPGSRFSVNDN